MNTNTTKKNQYFAPEVLCIKLDSDISLALQSSWGEPPIYEQLLNDGTQFISNQTFD